MNLSLIGSRLTTFWLLFLILSVVVGEPLEDSSPLIAHGTPVGGSGDVEAPSAVPIFEDRYFRRPPMPPPPPPGVYGTAHYGAQVIDPMEPGEDCAQLGCLFSWIPIVGFITCCIHAGMYIFLFSTYVRMYPYIFSERLYIHVRMHVCV
jgi:hypothetical protein